MDRGRCVCRRSEGDADIPMEGQRGGPVIQLIIELNCWAIYFFGNLSLIRNGARHIRGFRLVACFGGLIRALSNSVVIAWLRLWRIAAPKPEVSLVSDFELEWSNVCFSGRAPGRASFSHLYLQSEA